MHQILTRLTEGLSTSRVVVTISLAGGHRQLHLACASVADRLAALSLA